jgi:GNAT superfamily N-acetyltransferase
VVARATVLSVDDGVRLDLDPPASVQEADAAPADGDLLALTAALLADPRREGFQLIARDGAGRALGFATAYWSWSTLGAHRTAIMNDLYVHADARASGTGRALIEACRAHARRGSARSLHWQTAKDNERAQRLYARVGARREEWVDYSVDLFDP